jgi:hypothetical protein
MTHELTKCTCCGTEIIRTTQNPDCKCPFRFCKNYGYDSKEPQKQELKKYIGQCSFSVDLGDVVHCISTLGDSLICITEGYPTVLLISESEFIHLLQTEYLFS